MFRGINAFLVINCIIVCQPTVAYFGGRKGPLSISGSLTSHFTQTHRESKQVSNTLWNLLSIARYILCEL